MRKLLLTLIVLVLVATPAVAGETSRGNYTSPLIQQWLNENESFYHTHDFDLDNEYGIGADIKLIKLENVSILDSFGVEYRYDFMSQVNKIYGVIEIDLTKLWQ